MTQYFSYDPFDPAVMADPRPFYRRLRDEHPVYYIEKWDTFALCVPRPCVIERRSIA